MKIIVVADTHGDEAVLEKIVSSNLSADTFIHLGDGEREFERVRERYPAKAFIMVKGNNDYGKYPITTVVTLGGNKFYITHGSQFGRSALETYLPASAKANDCRIALFGHTHVPMNEPRDGVRLFNPGSPSLPRGMSRRSYGAIEANGDGHVTFSIIEL